MRGFDIRILNTFKNTAVNYTHQHPYTKIARQKDIKEERKKRNIQSTFKLQPAKNKIFLSNKCMFFHHYRVYRIFLHYHTTKFNVAVSLHLHKCTNKIN